MRVLGGRIARVGFAAAVALIIAVPHGATTADAAQVNNVAGACAFTTPDTQCSYTSITAAENILTIGNVGAPTILGGVAGGPLFPLLGTVCTVVGFVPGTTIGPFTVGPITINQITFGGATLVPVWSCQVNQEVATTIFVQAPGAVAGVATPL